MSLWFQNHKHINQLIHREIRHLIANCNVLWSPTKVETHSTSKTTSRSIAVCDRNLRLFLLIIYDIMFLCCMCICVDFAPFYKRDYKFIHDGTLCACLWNVNKLWQVSVLMYYCAPIYLYDWPSAIVLQLVIGPSRPRSNQHLAGQFRFLRTFLCCRSFWNLLIWRMLMLFYFCQGSNHVAAPATKHQ